MSTHQILACIITMVAILCAMPFGNNTHAQRASVSRSLSSNLCSDEDPKVVVRLATSKTKYYKNYSASTINAIHSVSGGGTILGLAGGPMEITTSGEFAVRTENGKSCIQLKNIEVLFWAKPVIIIASNFKKGTCEYREVFAHEQRHVRITRKFIREYAPKLKAEVKDIIATSRKHAIVPEGQITQAQEKLQRPIYQRLTQFQNTIMPVLQNRQAAIDTPAEYKKVSDKCDNWGKSLSNNG